MIAEFKAGTRICQPVLLRVLKVGNSQNGGVFARGMIEDNSGRMPFICFDAVLVEKMRDIDGAVPFMIAGNVDINKYQDQGLQIVIQKLNELLPEDDISIIVPRGNFDVKEYENKLQNYIRSVRTPALRALLENIFSGPLYDKFLTNPAGMRLHHAYLGGLLQHSVDVTSLAVAMAEQIDDVDKDLVVAGALLHDIGKLKEISQEVGFPYTNEGRLLGHISISTLMVQEAALKLHMSTSILQKLMHILLSHHGENEKGSPMACATKEAFIVHYADEINAIMNQFDNYNDKGNWEYNKMLGRFLFHEI